MKASTREDYRRRLVKVVDYIHDNLQGDLGVNTLADIAAMSPYHFHRIYREMVLETVNSTVRRLRLQRAAADLIRTKLPIALIAQNLSYRSTEAFSRAFTQQFGNSPAEYRLEKQSLSLEPFVATLPTEQKRYDNMYTVDIIDQEPLELIGYHHQGDYMEIGSVFEKLFIYGQSHGLISPQTRSIGLYYDDPKSVETNALRSMACITAPPTASENNEAPETIKIPAGRCATLLFKGPYPELEKPYDWLFGQWLPESGYEAANFPPFEEYLNDPRETPPNELLTRIHCLLVSK